MLNTELLQARGSQSTQSLVTYIKGRPINISIDAIHTLPRILVNAFTICYVKHSCQQAVDDCVALRHVMSFVAARLGVRLSDLHRRFSTFLCFVRRGREKAPTELMYEKGRFKRIQLHRLENVGLKAFLDSSQLDVPKCPEILRFRCLLKPLQTRKV